MYHCSWLKNEETCENIEVGGKRKILTNTAKIGRIARMQKRINKKDNEKNKITTKTLVDKNMLSLIASIVTF